jgi:hypothetical protein
MTGARNTDAFYLCQISVPNVESSKGCQPQISFKQPITNEDEWLDMSCTDDPIYRCGTIVGRRSEKKGGPHPFGQKRGTPYTFLNSP